MPTKPLIINIPEPCKQAWDDMRPDGQGRHCSNCQKTVTDFTAWTDAELHRFFTKNTGDVCGRFLSSQVDRAIVLPYQPHSRLYRLAIAMGLVLVFTGVPVSHARVPVRSAYEMMNGVQSEHDGDGKGKITGTVLDEKKEPVINAVVEVFEGDIRKGGVLTDYDGIYTVSPLPPGRYEVRVKYTGKKTNIVTGVTVFSDSSVTVNINLKNDGSEQEIIIISGRIQPMWDRPGSTIFRSSDIEKMPK